jgi:hypothetical protein
LIGTMAAAGNTITINSGFIPNLIVVGSKVSSSVLPNNTTISSITNMPVSFDVNKPATAIATAIPFTISVSPRFARIYAFSFEGAVYSLPKPSIFIVHGPGQTIDSANRTNVEQSGVAAREWEFSGAGTNKDLSYWEYEKGDFSLRLDSEAGPLEQILLQAALRPGADMGDRSGMSVGVRSGMSVSGMSLSGMSLSGSGTRTNR